MFGNVHVGHVGLRCAGLHALKHKAVSCGSGVKQDLEAAEVFFGVAWHDDVTVLRCRWLGGWRSPARSWTGATGEGALLALSQTRGMPWAAGPAAQCSDWGRT